MKITCGAQTTLAVKGLMMMIMSKGQGYLDSEHVLETCTGRSKTLATSKSLPVMDETAGVNTASLGGRLHSSKTWARWAERFHNELNSTWRGWAPSALPMSLHKRNQQPYHSESVAAWVNTDRTFRHAPGRRCQSMLLVHHRRLVAHGTQGHEEQWGDSMN